MQKFWLPDLYQRAWRFACEAHLGQTIPASDLPYVNHVGNVAMEIMTAIAVEGVKRDCDLAVACALLHDTIEDTDTTYESLWESFGKPIADGVAALSKDPDIVSKHERMADSLERIKRQAPEIWMVKLADRIVNLQPPPKTWSPKKIDNYRQESLLIHSRIRGASEYLDDRLAGKIREYERHHTT